MKACRKLLEEDLGLPAKSLADRKDFVQKYVDKVCPARADQEQRPVLNLWPPAYL